MLIRIKEFLMFHATRRRRMLARLAGLLAVVTLALPGPLSRSLPGQAAGQSKELSAQNRQKLEARAAELLRSGKQAYELGDFVTAAAMSKESLAIREALYPKDRYPRGHADLADSLNNVGESLRAQGLFVNARGYLERALSMKQSLYPKDRYPQGQPDLAMGLSNLGHLLQDLGAYAEARGCYERALTMLESLYPKDRYPSGHSQLAICLNNLAGVLVDQRSPGEARSYYERALAMLESLYPKDRYPVGHAELASGLNNLGSLLHDQRLNGEARRYYERALAMNEALYPSDRFPKGHANLARSLRNLGALLRDERLLGEAREYYQRALAMCQLLYPKDRYPIGHRDLVITLENLSNILWSLGSDADAAIVLCQAIDMQHALSETLAAASSEAEVRNYTAQFPADLSALISVSLRVPGSDDATYARIWKWKSTLTQTFRDRHAAILVLAANDPAVRRTLAAWRDARARLARLILATADGSERPGRAAMIVELTSEKERLERELAAAVPEFGRKRTLETSRHDDLVRALPEGAVIVDLLRFVQFGQNPQVPGQQDMRPTLSYVAFVLSKFQPVRMVALGPSRPIDDAVGQWRQATTQEQDSAAAEVLRTLVWQPLARRFPRGTAIVYLALDGQLVYIPWSALPGDRSGTVLLEEHAMATIPDAPFLLDSLTAPTRHNHAGSSGRVLAVGGVAYGQAPKSSEDERTRPQLLVTGPAEIESVPRGQWADLPATLQEVHAVIGRAGSREVSRLEGAEASTARFLQELPRARWAHIATHGFFADPSIRSLLTPDSRLFAKVGSESIGAGLRNPLVLSGLVLAGANLPQTGLDHAAADDHGILTAESIAGLDLSGLELVLLSACETALGLGRGGEGVFGLQRAFHMAGAHNVVASLWKVDDQATAALMTLFYDRLWRQGKSPIVALREAQLTLYHQPELVEKLTKVRGTPDFDKLVQLPEPGPSAGGSSSVRHAPARQWAAFVLSGYGR
jgi:CHAT domain-containing protein/tetratricopeptide (TPR) repeat protein